MLLFVLLGNNVTTCLAQELRINLIYTVATMANCFFVPVAGVLLDWQGPRRTFFMGTVMFSLGALLFGLSSDRCSYCDPNYDIHRWQILTSVFLGFFFLVFFFLLDQGGANTGIGIDLHIPAAALITTGGPLCFLANIALSCVLRCFEKKKVMTSPTEKR
jgi:MFS family permease